MPYNGSGTYAFPGAGGYPYQFNTVIDQGAVNALLGDVQSALNIAATRDGQAVWTGSLNMGNNSITNVKSLAALPAIGQTAASITFNNANPNTNSGQATFGIDASGVYVNSSILGSGTQLPIQLRQAGITYWSLATTGALSNTAPTSGVGLTLSGGFVANAPSSGVAVSATGASGAAVFAANGVANGPCFNALGVAATQLTGLQLNQSGQNPCSVYQPASSNDMRFFAVGADRIIISGTTTGVATFGTNTNDSAAAGFVGEYVTATNSAGTAMTTGTTLNVTSISLTAGDWDVGGSVEVNFTGTNSGFEGATNSTSATLPAQYLTISVGTVSGVATNLAGPVPQQRYSLSSTTTVFLVAISFFSGGAGTAFGVIWARRRR